MLIAYHGDATIKEKYLNRVKEHAQQDEIIKGQYWQSGKGCAVGCTIHSANHLQYENQLGIPVVLAKLEDYMFEGMANTYAKNWPEEFLAAIVPGTDLTIVWLQLCHWILVNPEYGVIRYVTNTQSKEAIEDVAALYKRWIDGDKPATSEWKVCRNAAAYAAADAAYAAYAYAAADAYAAYAAADAADAAYAAADAYAAYAAAYAAYAADAAYAAAVAVAAGSRENYWYVLSRKLLELLSSAPMVA